MEISGGFLAICLDQVCSYIAPEESASSSSVHMTVYVKDQTVARERFSCLFIRGNIEMKDLFLLYYFC